jgi:hypothetical protein
MTSVTVGIFTIDYSLRTNADPGADIQFGMDFTLTQTATSPPLPLTQMIFPATAVGTNKAGQWNIDNHKPASDDPACLIFANADNGVITDKPTELSKRNKGILTTKFAVYRVGIKDRVVQMHGVSFGYSIDTGVAKPATIFTGMKALDIPKDQQAILKAQCSVIKFK